MKLVDVLDSKSCVGNHVPVRVRPSANKKTSYEVFLFVVMQDENLLGSNEVRAEGGGLIAK